MSPPSDADADAGAERAAGAGAERAAGAGGEDAAGAAYRESLARHGMRDVLPAYRGLLVRLKKADPDAYEAAVGRYTDEVAVRAAAGEADPLDVWIEYGAWLARRLHPGETVAVDRTGRAAPLEGKPPPGSLVLHLPEEKRQKAIALAVPEEPSGPQEATVELICG